ncbi:MAG: hypothetical protein ACP5G4_12165 [bacterium]
MAKKRIIKLPYSEFKIFFELMVRAIANNMGEPFNPDSMLAEGQVQLADLDSKQLEADMFDMMDNTRADDAEDAAFAKLKLHLSSIKKFVDFVVGEKWLATLDIPSRMPRSREKVRESARAVLSAWDEHSADPELAHVIPAMDELRAAFDAWTAAWDAQQDANRIKKEKYRASREARAKCEKFVSRVKKYLSLYLAPDDSKWGLYGFEVRGEE